jgi:site-specific recombinase XerD
MSIDSDIKEYLVFVSQVKNLSENTTKSYQRDLKKLCLFLESLNIKGLYRRKYGYLFCMDW